MPVTEGLDFDIDAYRARVEEAAAAVRAHLDLGTDPPRIGLILGTGLGKLADEIEIAADVSYDDLPHFPVSTVESDPGLFI